jgi:hypothetical protein
MQLINFAFLGTLFPADKNAKIELLQDKGIRNKQVRAVYSRGYS